MSGWDAESVERRAVCERGESLSGTVSERLAEAGRKVG